MNEIQVIAFFDELEKEAARANPPSVLGHPSDAKWKGLIGGLALATAAAGTGIGYKEHHPDTPIHKIPSGIVEHVKGPKPTTYSIPKTMLADSPKYISKFKKVGSAAEHLTEIAGLGVLAKPSIDRLRGKEVDERKAAKQEIAGLGILAAPSALKLGKSAYNKFKTFKG
jgi:hypothetical protein